MGIGKRQQRRKQFSLRATSLEVTARLPLSSGNIFCHDKFDFVLLNARVERVINWSRRRSTLPRMYAEHMCARNLYVQQISGNHIVNASRRLSQAPTTLQLIRPNP